MHFEKMICLKYIAVFQRVLTDNIKNTYFFIWCDFLRKKFYSKDQLCMLKTARGSAFKKCSGFSILQYILCILADNIRIIFFFIWCDFCFDTSGYRVVLPTKNSQKGGSLKKCSCCSILQYIWSIPKLNLFFSIFSDFFLQKLMISASF